MSDVAIPAHTPYPRPIINQDNQFLYEGFEARELRIQKCEDCGYLRFPPSPMCPRCQSMNWTTIVSSGRGKVHSYTIHHHPPILPFKTPHVVALVDLEEGVRFLAPLMEETPGTVTINMDVQLRFVDVESDLTMPQFVPAIRAGA